LSKGEDPSPDHPQRPSLRGTISARQALGILLLLLLVTAGRVVRSRLLIDPEGQWRQQLWLDELLASDQAAMAVEKPPKPQLTDPLPINTCSLDSLVLLPGVGPVLADRIDAARKAGTVFRSPLDLEVVKGIGPAMSARLAPVIDFQVPGQTQVRNDSLPKQDPMSAISR
jgi:hypothetical protein